MRPAALALGAYGGVWLGFNLVRAVANDAGLAVASQTRIASMEAALFGGALPTEWLQGRFHDPDRIRAHDTALALVHASFFVVPFMVGAALWWKRRAVFATYVWATAIAFGLGLVGFMLVPTAPPWLSDPDSVTRITLDALTALTPGAGGSTMTQDPRLGFEPNHLAAMPSIHVAAAVLAFLACRAAMPRLGWGALASLASLAYPLAMTLAVVYLGEHFLLDAALGWGVAIIGWRLADGRAGRGAADRKGPMPIVDQ